MSLQEIRLPALRELPERIQHIITAGEKRIDDFVRPRRDGEIAGFVPADYLLVASALVALRHHDLLAGDLVVEWGSGMGIVTMVAAELGYEAYGIEILPELVQEGESLARRLGIDCVFSCGSFVPESAQDTIEVADEGFWIDDGGQDGHELLDLEPQDADLVYAYPWPGEQLLFEALFDRIAGSGALFLTYNGVEGLRLLRKR